MISSIMEYSDWRVQILQKPLDQAPVNVCQRVEMLQPPNKPTSNCEDRTSLGRTENCAALRAKKLLKQANVQQEDSESSQPYRQQQRLLQSCLDRECYL
jgi:hypothetical protein